MRNSFLETFRRVPRRWLLPAFLLTASSTGYCQFTNMYPQASCAEYLTAPGTNLWLAHFSVWNPNGTTQREPAGRPQNYFTPGPTYPGQIQVFAPGYLPDVNIIEIDLSTALTWTIFNNSASINTLSYTGADSVKVATCAPRLQPVALTFTQPGVYTHQYLGQVQAGPTSGTALALSSDVNVVISNVTYIANDAAQRSLANPNSIYGDVTVTGSGGSANLLLQLLVDNVTVTDGVVTVAY